MGDEKRPNVPSVAPLWPSADVVAQQSVSVIVLKPFSKAVRIVDSTQQFVRKPQSTTVSILCALSCAYDGPWSGDWAARDCGQRVRGPWSGRSPMCVPKDATTSGQSGQLRSVKQVQADMGDDRTIVPRKFATIDEVDDEDGFWTDPE